MHHGRGPPPNRGMHEGDGRGPPSNHRGGHYDSRGSLERGDHHEESRHSHRGHYSHRGDDDQRHRDHESWRRGHEGSSRGHDGRSHRPHESDRHHQNNTGLSRRPSHERHNGGGRPSLHNNGPPPPPPSDNRHRNGPDKPRPPPPLSTNAQQPPAPGTYTAYKLVIDPFLHRDQEKVYRVDGVTPGEQRPMEIVPKDPRKKQTSIITIDVGGKNTLDLPLPRFLIDDHYVGEVPKVEVTFESLNDNIDKQFLGKTITKYAEWESIKILYHPVTQKHLGLAKAVFKSCKGARQCVNNLHLKTIMGQSIHCYLDPGGKACDKIFEDLTVERKPSPPPPQPVSHEEEELLPPHHDGAPPWGEGEGASGWGGEQGSWGGPGTAGNSRSGHSWQGGDGGDDWRQRNHGGTQPHWDDEDAQPEWPVERPYNRQQPTANERRRGRVDPRRGRDRDRRGKGEWRRSQEDLEDSSSRWSEEHSRFQENSNHGYPVESDTHLSMPPTIPLPEVEPQVEPETEAITPEQAEDEDHSVDLDTRLAMLMQKGKSNMPPFLVCSESSADEGGTGPQGGDAAAAPEPEQPPPQPPPARSGPLSRTPSPFASRETYLESFKITAQEELRSVNEALANIPAVEHTDTFQPPPFTGGHFAGAPPGHFPGQFGAPGFPSYHWGAGGHVPGNHMPDVSHFPGSAEWGQADYQDPYWEQRYDSEYQGQHDDYYQHMDHQEDHMEGTKKKSGKDLLNNLMENVIKIVQTELKAILKKDINKKLCESYAYLLFDKWWSEQEAQYKAKQELEFKKKAGTSSNTTLRLPDRERVEALPRIPKPEDVTNLIEKQRESGTSSFGLGGSLGFGFRGSIPKMAKKVEKKVPKENKAPDTSNLADKDDKKKHKEDGEDKIQDKDLETDSKDKKKSPKGGKKTGVYSEIYSDSDSDKKEESESSTVETSDQDEEESESSESDDDSSSDSSSGSSSSDEESGDEKSDAASAKSRDSSADSNKSRSSSLSPLSKDKKPKRRSRSKSKSPLKTRSISRSKSRSNSRSLSPKRRSKSRSKSRSTSPVSVKAESPLPPAKKGGKKSPGSRDRRKSSSSASLPETPKPSSSAVKPLDDVFVSAQTPLDRRRKSLDSESISSSPALSRPPTPEIKPSAGSSKAKKDLPPLRLPPVAGGDNSDTETGSEVEIVEEVKSPRSKEYSKLKDDDSATLSPSTPGKEATSAAAALLALSAASSAGGLVGVTPVKVQNVAYSPPHIMDHCYARPAPIEKQKTSSTATSSITAAVTAAANVASAAESSSSASRGFDHDYTKPRTPPRAAEIFKERPAVPAVKERVAATKKSSLPAAPVKFQKRDMAEKFQILYKFLTEGIDTEDVMYIKRSYEMMLNEGLNQPNLAWINDTHWVDHPVTLVPDPPKKKRRVDDFSRPHKSGCARTEGYYKMHPREKMRTKYHFHRPGVDAFNTGKLGDGKQQKPQKAINVSREARSQQRRLLTALGEEFNESELLKFNQLKFRRKAMKFGKSAIHDWGLFAMEHIGADEMVIEYVGDVVRPILSDIREKRYEKQGIGSSYLFRIDQDYVVDATKCGNLARFINHSCEPNCYAKVIKIDGESKIVIYSKQPIAIGEEITYDYKFPIEDEKIRCLCGEKNCRKYLN